jgi:hypothetical protein
MKNIFIFLAILFTIVSCKDEKITNDLNIVNGKKLLQGWKKFENDTIKVHIPSNWKSQKEEGVLLYFPLNKGNANLYYVILKTDISIVSVKNYIKEIFRQIALKDKNFTYLLTKINFENNACFYTIDFYTKEKGITYKAYCLIYQKRNMIYDFSYKCFNNEETNIDNYRIFYNTLFSFEFKHDNIVDSENFIIKNEEIIKYEDL